MSQGKIETLLCYNWSMQLRCEEIIYLVSEIELKRED